MIEKYIIIGGGPTGLLLSLLLGISKYDVTLIEKSKKLGGSWKVEWDGKYFTEISPRILHSAEETFNKLLKYLNITNSSEFNYVYGNIIHSNLKLVKYFIEHFTLLDWLKFIFASIFYRNVNSRLTVEEWLNKNNFSNLGKKALRTFSIAISDRSDNVMLNDMFGSVEIGYFYQLANPEKWIDQIKLRLDLMPNVNVYTNSEVLSIQTSGNKVNYVKVKIKGKIVDLEANHYILTVPPLDLLSIANKSDQNIKNNWMRFENFRNWCEKSSYGGFGFQLHFKDKIKFPYDWCWSCREDWVIMILPISDYANISSYDKNIKTVWSACIVDMDKKSSFLKKTPNECNSQEILNECIRLIKNGYYNSTNHKLPQFHLTTSYGLNKIDGKWISKNSSFTRNKLGYLNVKGDIENLYSVGPHNDLGHNSIVTINRALDSALNFLRKQKINALGFYKKGILDYIKIIIKYIIFFYILYKFFM